jgi:hypothetical protein
MGHITIVRNDAAEAWDSVSTLRRALQRERFAAERA